MTKSVKNGVELFNSFRPVSDFLMLCVIIMSSVYIPQHHKEQAYRFLVLAVSYMRQFLLVSGNISPGLKRRFKCVPVFLQVNQNLKDQFNHEYFFLKN